jgi:hypothetical protein
VVLNGAAVIEPHPSRHSNSNYNKGKMLLLCVGTSTHTKEITETYTQLLYTYTPAEKCDMIPNKLKDIIIFDIGDVCLSLNRII